VRAGTSGEIVVSLSVPVFIKGQRFGVCSIGWAANPNVSLTH
jgi:hypothetical protein